MDFYEAVDYLNDITEHRYGSGPIEDGGHALTRAISDARRLAADGSRYVKAATVEAAVAAIKGGPRR